MFFLNVLTEITRLYRGFPIELIKSAKRRFWRPQR